MRILLFGNINSGKTTAAEILQQILPQYHYISIDQFRKLYGNGSVESEKIAQLEFVKKASQSEHALIESSGLGPLGNLLHQHLPPKTSVILYFDTSLEECLTRIQSKDFSASPYPKSPETIEETITRCHTEFLNGDLHSLWEDSALIVIPIHSNQPLDKQLHNIPYKKYSSLVNTIEVLKKIDSNASVIWYGSGPTGRLTKYSDIDLFYLSSKSLNQIFNSLKNEYFQAYYVDKLNNKIMLFFDPNNLVEISCDDKIDSLEKFYCESGILNHSWSVLYGDRNILEAIRAFTKKYNENSLIEYLITEIVYFVATLPKLSQKNDRYKFFFHSNIILHNMVRLEKILRREFHKNFLPEQSYETLNSFDWNTFNFKLTDDLGIVFGQIYRSVMNMIYNLNKEYTDLNDKIDFMKQISYELTDPKNFNDGED